MPTKTTMSTEDEEQDIEVEGGSAMDAMLRQEAENRTTTNTDTQNDDVASDWGRPKEASTGAASAGATTANTGIATPPRETAGEALTITPMTQLTQALA